MFNVSDSELDGLEASRPTERQPAGFSPIPGFGAYGDDGGTSDDQSMSPPSPSAGPIPWAPAMPAPALAPPGASDAAAAKGAGLALLWVTGGLVAGWLAGGAYGAASGVVGVGAIRNIARVKSLWSSPNPVDRTEAGKSATMAIFGLGIAGMLGYHAYHSKKEDDFPW